MKYFYRYLQLTEEMRRQKLYVIAEGYTLIPPGVTYPPLPHPQDHDFRWNDGRTLQEFQLIYITRGAGIFESKTGGVHEIRVGSMFMLFPGEWHRYKPYQETGWDEYWIAFDGETSDFDATVMPFSPTNPVLDIGLNEALLEEFVHVTEDTGIEAVGYQQIIAARTQLILAIASALFQRQSSQSDMLRIIERAKCVMLEQIDTQQSVESIAADLGISYSAFRRAFRQCTGMSPAKYHMQLRLNTARELLRSTALPIAVIGERVGFDTAYYFTRIFREKTGLTPSSYRTMSQARRDGHTDSDPAA